MPYNTRRKSLSLPALGIQLPQTSRAHRASISKPTPPIHSSAAPDAPPAKRVKRAHASSTSLPLSPPATATPASATTVKSVTFADRPQSSGRAAAVFEHTPPPSPGRAEATRIDVEGINDAIVVGVIEQLEKTGNRPHLIKELATVLSTTNTSVSNSANPAALLSSRLASYMRRPWTALAPCPIAKELIPVHPRKVFYYLTTTPRQEMPTTPTDLLPVGGKGGLASGKRIISPSLSNASQDDDEDVSMAEDRKRAALSPSPEVDLSFDLDEVPPATEEDALPDFPTPGSTLSSQRASMARDGHEPERDLGLNHRAESPPLEGDEREFTDTARGMRLRGMSGSEDDLKRAAATKAAFPDAAGRGEIEEEGTQTNSEAVRALFGPHHHHQATSNGHLAAGSSEGAPMSSPMIKPVMQSEMAIKMEVHPAAMADVAMTGGPMDLPVDEIVLGIDWEIGRPENMDLDELEDFFEGF